MCKSNSMSEENFDNVTKSDRNFAPFFVYYLILPGISFNGRCFIKHNTSILKIVLNLYIFHKLNSQLRN